MTNLTVFDFLSGRTAAPAQRKALTKADEYMLMKDALRAGLAPCPVSAEAVVGRTLFSSLRNRVSVKMIHPLPKSASMIFLPLPEAIRLMHALPLTIQVQMRVNKAVRSTFVKKFMSKPIIRHAISIRPALQLDFLLIQRAVESERNRLASLRHVRTGDAERRRLMHQFAFAVRRMHILVNRMIQAQEELAQRKGHNQ